MASLNLVVSLFTITELMGADKILVTLTSNFCLHTEQIDGTPVGGNGLPEYPSFNG